MFKGYVINTKYEEKLHSCRLPFSDSIPVTLVLLRIGVSSGRTFGICGYRNIVPVLVKRTVNRTVINWFNYLINGHPVLTMWLGGFQTTKNISKITEELIKRYLSILCMPNEYTILKWAHLTPGSGFGKRIPRQAQQQRRTPPSSYWITLFNWKFMEHTNPGTSWEMGHHNWKNCVPVNA